MGFKNKKACLNQLNQMKDIMMNLYLLRNKWHTEYRAIVAASSVDEALLMHPEGGKIGPERNAHWPQVKAGVMLEVLALDAGLAGIIMKNNVNKKFCKSLNFIILLMRLYLRVSRT
jgi:hypothetical protein